MLRSLIAMEPTQWERTKAHFGQALEFASDQRAAIVTAASGDDGTLRGDVLSLLACDDEAGDFLEPPAAARLALDGDADAVPRLAPAHRLGRYEIVSFLGAGAVSDVYRARDTRLGRIVALKLLTDPTAPDGAEWLLREAQHASTLNHPHICTVHEVDECEWPRSTRRPDASTRSHSTARSSGFRSSRSSEPHVALTLGTRGRCLGAPPIDEALEGGHNLHSQTHAGTRRG